MQRSRPSAFSVLMILLSVLWLLLLVFFLESASAEAPRLRWQRSTLFPGLGEVSALAFDPDTGRLAVGDEQGVWVSSGVPAAARVLRRGPVRDLAFGSDAGLYAATDRGLFHLSAAGEVSERSLGAGARAVRRILVTSELVLAATAGGAFVSRDGWSWARLDAGLPAGAVDAIALRPSPGGAILWLIVEGAVQRATLHTGAGRLVFGEVVQVSIAGGGGRRSALDLSTSIPGAEVAVLFRSGLSLQRDGFWKSFRPAFPPGAEPLRLGHLAGRLWIATDRGLLEAASPSGPWDRVAPPVGNTPVAVLAGGGSLVYAAGAQGLFAGRPQTEPAEQLAPVHPSKTLGAEEPSVHQLHLAAIRYLDLGPQRIRALARGVRRRGWLPRFELRGSYGGDRSRQRDYDEAFTYDAPRLFVDRERERGRDFSLSTALIWELGDLAYHPESLDVSKEAREIIELRDDVLDEISQLYFERRRTLLQLASQPQPQTGEAARLRLRADELGSGLDAWTGGWWSRVASSRTSYSPRSTPEETQP
jgi:hypothetical protein